MKPVVMDMCVTLKLADLPTQQVRRPYERFYRLTLFGREIMGLRMSGESRSSSKTCPMAAQWCGARSWGGARPVFPGERPGGPDGLRIRSRLNANCARDAALL